MATNNENTRTESQYSGAPNQHDSLYATIGNEATNSYKFGSNRINNNQRQNNSSIQEQECYTIERQVENPIFPPKNLLKMKTSIDEPLIVESAQRKILGKDSSIDYSMTTNELYTIGNPMTSSATVYGQLETNGIGNNEEVSGYDKTDHN